MKRQATRAAKRLLRTMGVGLTRYETLQELWASSRAAGDVAFISAMPETVVYDVVQNLPYSKAQLRQDLFVLAELDFRSNGFFVEFGATNGVDLNNTHLLEERFGWNGILAEPARIWRDELTSNRRCHIVFDCVWSRSGETVLFNEVDRPEFSTVERYSDQDLHGALRRRGTTYPVQTISLLDLLDQHGAPKHIDYLSIDTEGSEYSILSAFDFDAYRFSIITCEHNYTSNRGRVEALLTSHGYERRLAELSHHDDWYVFTG